MKRILSLIMVLCLMATLCGTAFAEEIFLVEMANGYDIVLITDEEISIEPVETDADDLNSWIIDDSVHTPVTLSIALSEIGGDISLIDCTEEEQMQLGKMAGAMFENPEIHLDTTPSGNLYLHICSNEQSDIDSIFTIYKGCFVELVQYKEDFSQLSDEDREFCLSILHAIEFVEKN